MPFATALVSFECNRRSWNLSKAHYVPFPPRLVLNILSFVEKFLNHRCIGGLVSCSLSNSQISVSLRLKCYMNPRKLDISCSNNA